MTEGSRKRIPISARLPEPTWLLLKTICDVWGETITSALDRSVRTAHAVFGLSAASNDIFLRELRRSTATAQARLVIDTETLEVDCDQPLFAGTQEVTMKAAMVPLGNSENQLVLFPETWSMPKASELFEVVTPRPVLAPSEYRFSGDAPPLVALRVADLEPSPTLGELLAEVPDDLMTSLMGIETESGGGS